ncbi:hypothetical protein HF086_006710, partial [Spodoptera exigua]
TFISTAQDEVKIIDLSPWKANLHNTSEVTCTVAPENAEISWMFQAKPLVPNNRTNATTSKKDSTEGERYILSILSIKDTNSEDAGNYTCVAKVGSAEDSKVANLDLSFPARLVNTTSSPIRENVTNHANINLECVFEAYNPGEVRWWTRTKDNVKLLSETNNTRRIGGDLIKSTYVLHIYGIEDNGTYACELDDLVSSTIVSGKIDVLLTAKPQIIIENVIPINTTHVYINWTVHAFNSPIKEYRLMYLNEKNMAAGFRHYTVPPKIDAANTSFLLGGLEKGTTYTFKMQVVTEYDESNRDSPESLYHNVTMLSEDPVFVPNISINGFSATSVTIGWAPPPDDIADLIHYYILEAQKKDNGTINLRACHERNGKNLPYMFDNLEPHSTYVFKVQACSDYSNSCGNWSEKMEAATLDGVPGVPSNVVAKCSVDFLNLTWSAPLKPNAEIKGYTILENGTYMFKMYLPRMSERNGPICCYRVYMVRLPTGNIDWKRLPSPRDIDVLEYKDSQTKLGAYVADVFSNDKFTRDNIELVLGDDKVIFDKQTDPTLNQDRSSSDPDEALFSEYTSLLMPAASPPVPVPSTALEIALQSTLLYHRYWDSIRGRQPLVSTVPPDIPPIPKDELAAAYAQRQVDSDYGFQKEFEVMCSLLITMSSPHASFPINHDISSQIAKLLQMLPECFPDRTTHASEARENQPKNRYPDIKAYDQTRVKLSQIDGITGSDYINANYVMGYQERKQFICAQGPTDTTVNDFWRMIWEHGLELIVMLTNLEEYSKVKCSKYWPEERSSRAFGGITVHHIGEKRYSDYIVRELKITKQPLTADGQPIVENNGIAKRNGDIKEASESSAPTSPREVKESGECRIVRQYHFLMWKDFAAPEHPHSILKFIKRVNEAWTSMVGRPVVVHCSAGVGRTVEYAHYGDTEIPASRLKPAVDRLRNTPDHADKCLMEVEFEKMLNSPVAEPLKSMGAGAGEELRARNRSPDCLPYDRNRVILTPIPGRDFSTYINASFIEGKCPRYWDDGTVQYEHISVQYEESESCPYYTRRQFRVTNDKRKLTSTSYIYQETKKKKKELVYSPINIRPLPPRFGTERSPLFVALCTLIRALRVERRVDVSATARAVRTQRARTIDTFLQYEFLYRAILNYAELHNLLEDS